jgi:hypothetical protein
MRISRHLTTVALAAACAVAGITPASAAARTHGVNYAGKTRDGDPMSFTLVGSSKITNVKAYVPTLCGSTQGFPMHGTDPFDPPGSFPLTKTTKVTAKRPNAIWNTADVTKNFAVSFKRGRHNIITGTLHSDFSFLFINFGSYPISSRPYVCTGDTKFTFQLPKKR